jgi:Domain of unknown function(DUF2779)
MQNKRYLTKSRFKLALECPTKLYYTGKGDYANTKNDNEFLAMLADGGFQVGELAKLKYPDGVEISTGQVDQAIAETSELLKLDTITLFEPAIIYEGFLIRVDVLVKRGHVFEVIEVKAKSYSGDPASLTGKRSPISGEFLSYVQDVAFQKFVIQSAFPRATVSAYLLMPDKSKQATVTGLNQWFKIQRQGRDIEVQLDKRAKQCGLADSVLTCVPVDHLVSEVFSNPLPIPGGEGMLKMLATTWAKQYAADQKVPPVIGGQCSTCEFKSPVGASKRSGFHECWKEAKGWSDSDFSVGTVLDLWNFRGKDRLIQQGVCKLSQVREDDLKLSDHEYSPLSNAERQWMQVKGLPADSKAQGYYLDRSGLSSAMQEWKYPLHLIDFETASVALPFHAGRRPYEQIAFQFSHHVLEADGRLRHVGQFLSDTPGEFPNYEFVRALHEALRHDQGTIMRWSHHENSILNAIKDQLNAEFEPPSDKDELISFIECITKDGPRAMVDLAEIARKHYFHPSTQGSCSIKKVLPAVMQSSDFLRRTYGRPLYGSIEELPSLNFNGVAWWQQSADGKVLDPYKLLLSDFGDEGEEAEKINQGGAASNAYLRLQFEALPPETRIQLRKALLKYCELDTLAMGLVLQGWFHS